MKIYSTAKVLGAALGLTLVSATSVRAVEVRFQVDMSVVTATQDFYPGFDTVELHGSFDGWGSGITLGPSQADPAIYEGTLDITDPPATEVFYKFVIRQEGGVVEDWERDGVGPNGEQNRMLQVPEAPLTLPVVFFNNYTTIPANVAVTFQVNLSIQELMGDFDPATQSVGVRGGFLDDWGTSLVLSASLTDPDVYVGTTDIFGSAGEAFDYKFVIDQGEGEPVWEGDVGEAGASNRSLTLEENSQILPVVFFNNLTSDPGAGIAVTFAVNLGVQAALGLFDPASDTVVVAGQFNNWSTTDSPLENSVEEPYVYQGTFQVKAAVGTSVPHKFVINADGWETGADRTFQLADSAQILPLVFFDRQNDLGTVTVGAVSATELTLEWTAASGIRLQTSTSIDTGWEDVPNTTGQGSAIVPIGSGNAYYRLTGP